MPLDLAQRAIDSFPMMVELRVHKERGAFEDIRRTAPPELMGRPAPDPSSGAPRGEASERENVE